jgi:hypothetical protein
MCVNFKKQIVVAINDIITEGWGGGVISYLKYKRIQKHTKKSIAKTLANLKKYKKVNDQFVSL